MPTAAPGLSGERYSILLTHRPELTRYYRESGFDLVVAATPTAGRCGFPVWGVVCWPPTRACFPGTPEAATGWVGSL